VTRGGGTGVRVWGQHPKGSMRNEGAVRDTVSLHGFRGEIRGGGRDIWIYEARRSQVTL